MRVCDYYGPSQTPYYRNRARDFKLPEQHTLHEEYANPRMGIPKGSCTQIVYTWAPKYLYKDY